MVDSTRTAWLVPTARRLCNIAASARHPLLVQLPFGRKRGVGLGGCVTLNVNMPFATSS